ncbi:ATP-binding protein [Paenibacillus sp. WLX2291]|uniref:HAMP domain-containing sensor histidine kinase n=1 Tax=Paenibacillus sp. WLX2291 TaxID=3296934 RepID=UPI003983DE2B
MNPSSSTPPASHDSLLQDNTGNYSSQHFPPDAGDGKARRPRFSLRWKFPLLLGALLLFTVCILSILVLSGIRSNQQQQIEQLLLLQSQLMETRIRQLYLTGTRLDPVLFMQRRGNELAVDLGSSSNMRVILYDNQGELRGDSLPLGWRSDTSSALRYALQGRTAYITEGSNVLYLAPVYGTSGLLGVVQLHVSIADQQAFYRNMLLVCIYTGGIVLSVSFGIGWLYIRRQTKDIRTLMKQAQSISRGHYPEPGQAQPVQRNDELGQLGDGIAEMGSMIQQSMNELEREKSQLQQAVAKLSALEQLQKAFIGNISHELKTPATSIQSYADLLSMYGDDPELVQEASASISSEIRRLIELIEDSIRLSLLEKYDFELHPEPVSLNELVREATERTRGKAANRDISLHVELDAPVVITADPKHLMHILLNLLDNAVKYNVPQQGWIMVQTEIKQQHVRFRIGSSGPIIPSSQWDMVFEPYTTLSQDRSRTGSGTGLGLPLARRLTERMNGSLSIASSDEHGTFFVLDMPL